MLQPEEHPLLVCEPPLNPAATRERLCDLAFATFGFQSFYLANSHQLALYAAGKTTGTVVEVSAGSSSVAATYEGYLLHHTVKVGVGGNALAACLFPALERAGLPASAFATARERQDCALDIVQRLGAVRPTLAQDPDDACTDAAFRLERGSAKGVTVAVRGDERIACGEELFKGPQGLAEILQASLMATDVDAGEKRDYWSNIVLSGGVSLLPGLAARLLAEAQEFPGAARAGSTPGRGVPVKLATAPDPAFSAVAGGSVLGALSTFGSMWVTKREWEAEGPGIVARKCPV